MGPPPQICHSCEEELKVAYCLLLGGGIPGCFTFCFYIGSFGELLRKSIKQASKRTKT